MDHRHDDDRLAEHDSGRLTPDEAPDPVETRDPDSHPTPGPGRAWLYAIPAVALVVLGGTWMFWAERARDGAQSAPSSVAGTSGAAEDGLARGDEKPLNPAPDGPRVIGDMALLTAKEDYIGRAVEIGAIPVMSAPGPRTLWVGRPMNRTLVLLDRSIPGMADLPAGQPVRVSGRLEKRPEKEEIDRAGLHENDRSALEGVDVFIRASLVAPQQRSGPTDAPAR